MISAQHYKYIFLLLLFLAAATPAFTQAYRLQGTIREAATGDPIATAQVRVQGRLQGTLTDAAGRFILELDEPAKALEITHIGYKKLRYPLAGKSPRALDILMETASEITPVVISAGVERILEDKTIHLYDYEWMDDRLMLIVYDRKLRRSKLAVVDERDSIIDTELLTEEPGKLVKDCLGNVHAITQHYACQLFWEEDGIGYYQDSLPEFEKVVLPCIGNLEVHYYYDAWAFNNQILDYFDYDMETREWKPFLHVVDKVRMHQLMDPLGPYVSIAPSEAHMYALTQENWKEIGKIDAEFQFQQLAFFTPVDAPLRLIDGKVYVFDHLNGLIRSFEKGGKKLAEVPMDYHKLNNRQKLIVVDEQRGEAYAVFDKHGYSNLRRIDLETGTLGAAIDIPRQFPHKIQVRDGIAYFMYKEGHYDEVNRIYRMAL